MFGHHSSLKLYVLNVVDEFLPLDFEHTGQIARQRRNRAYNCISGF